MDAMEQSIGLDRTLIGHVVRDEIPRARHIRTVSGLGHEARMSRSKIYEVFDGAENTSQSTYRRIEGAFDWPTDTLLYVGIHDVASLVEIGAPRSIVDRVRKELGKASGEAGRVVGGSA